MNAALHRMEIEILAARLTFVKVLAEGFDYLAKDRCDGLCTIAEMCRCRAENFEDLGMNDEAELLLYLTDTLRSCLDSEDRADTHEVCVFARLEFVQNIMARLIERLVPKAPVRIAA